MMKQSELTTAVRDMIEARLANGEPAATSWIVREFAVQHPALEGPDQDLHELCMYGHVRWTVRDVLRGMHSEEPEEQTRFEASGFQHLQRRYTIERGEDEQVVVPLERMTPEECEAKADELQRMADGCMAHAAELRQYARMQRDAHAA